MNRPSNEDWSLAHAYLENHPEEAARDLEALPVEEVVAFLRESRPSAAAAVVERMLDQRASSCIDALSPADAHSLTREMPVGKLARLLRPLEVERRKALLEVTDEMRRRAVERLLHYPDGSAGALMDPLVAAARPDDRVGETIRRIESDPKTLRFYVFVVDESGGLLGVASLPELKAARSRAVVREIMRRDVERLSARASGDAIAKHPGWREFHALPVLDENNVLIGVLEHRVLQSLHDPDDRSNRVSSLPLLFGELYWVGASRVLGELLGMFRAPDPAERKEEP
jgi:magnesium transporter